MELLQDQNHDAARTSGRSTFRAAKVLRSERSFPYARRKTEGMARNQTGDWMRDVASGTQFGRSILRRGEIALKSIRCAFTAVQC